MIVVHGQVAPVDILAIGIHPDDIELSCAGTLLSHMAQGYTAGICDLTRGELGTRGNAETRLKESSSAAEILGVDWRINLAMRDGFSKVDEDHILKIAEVIRLVKPRFILANAIQDRHPDHGRGAILVKEANFFAGLVKIDSVKGEPHRADAVYNYIQDEYVDPDLCIDIIGHVDKKMESILAYKTQFFQPDDSGGLQTPISSQAFMEFQVARMRHFGRAIGVEFAEGYTSQMKIGVKDLGSLL